LGLFNLRYRETSVDVLREESCRKLLLCYRPAKKSSGATNMGSLSSNLSFVLFALLLFQVSPVTAFGAGNIGMGSMPTGSCPG